MKIAMGAIYAWKSEIRKRDGLASLLGAIFTEDYFGRETGLLQTLIERIAAGFRLGTTPARHLLMSHPS